MCIDYRDLNRITLTKKYLILCMDDISNELHGARILSNIDLTLIHRENNFPNILRD